MPAGTEGSGRSTSSSTLAVVKLELQPFSRSVISACDLSVLPDYKMGICLVLYLLGIQVPSLMKSPTRHVYFFIGLIFFFHIGL